MSANGPTVVAAAIGSLLLITATVSSLSKSKGKVDNESINEDDCITASEVTQIFDALFIQMQSVLAQLSQQIQQIQMTGQSIPEKQLRQLLVAEFERALSVKEKSLLQDHKIDEDCLQEATWQMMDLPEEYPKVVASVERFQKLYENISGKSIVGRRPGDGKTSAANDALTVSSLSKEELLEAAAIYFDALTDSMGEIVRRFKDEGKNLQEPVVAQEIQMQLLRQQIKQVRLLLKLRLDAI